MLYQLNSSGGTLSGNTIKYNVFVGNDDGVVLWDGKYTTAQGKGAVSFYRNVYDGNTKAVTSESYTSGKSFAQETYYDTGSVKTQSHSTFYLKAGSISVKDSIVYISAGYNFYAASGAKLSVSYTTFIGTGHRVPEQLDDRAVRIGRRPPEPGLPVARSGLARLPVHRQGLGRLHGLLEPRSRRGPLALNVADGRLR
jgi:hypothetical protein